MSNKKTNKTPEIHLHSRWMNVLKRANISFTAWGSAGPDMLLDELNGILEVKNGDTDSIVRSAYDEIFARRGHKSFCPDSRAFVGVITPDHIYVWLKDKTGNYLSADKPNVVFNEDERKPFVEYIKTYITDRGLYLDDHIEDALKSIYHKKCPNPDRALLAMLNIHKSPVYATNSSIVFGAETKNERVLEVTPEEKRYIFSEIINKYKVRDIDDIKSHIRHSWSVYQPDSKKALYGKYYTPKHLVDEVKKMLSSKLNGDHTIYIADLAAGCGAFLSDFEEYRVLGRDIDESAVKVMKEMGFTNIEHDNSLCNISRDKLGVGKQDELVIVGNPPYNNVTSKNKRYRTDAKAVDTSPVDEDVSDSDYGISFLRAYAKLDAKYICVLHPLSYLVKKSNFNKLACKSKDTEKTKLSFASNYTLDDAIVFSSSEFMGAITGSMEFPIVIALYKKGVMDYEFIRQYPFKLYDRDEGNFKFSKKILKLSNVNTIDDNNEIRKYPPSKTMSPISDIGLYQYNIRDANSLMTSGALSEITDSNRVPVQFAELWKYCYLNVFKRYFGSNYVFGNLSPLMSNLGNDDFFRDLCIIDTVFNNQNLTIFSPGNPQSFIVKKYLINEMISKAQKSNSDQKEYYQAFVDYWKGGAFDKTICKSYFIKHFAGLRENALLKESDLEFENEKS